MNNRNYFKLLIFAPVLLYACVFLFGETITRLLGMLPICALYSTFGLLCPGCGNTRSIKALLGGNIFLSLTYNATPFFLFIIASAFYIEVILRVFGSDKKIIPRSNYFIYGLICVFLLYFFVRNIGLLRW